MVHLLDIEVNSLDDIYLGARGDFSIDIYSPVVLKWPSSDFHVVLGDCLKHPVALNIPGPKYGVSTHQLQQHKIILIKAYSSGPRMFFLSGSTRGTHLAIHCDVLTEGNIKYKIETLVMNFMMWYPLCNV